MSAMAAPTSRNTLSLGYSVPAGDEVAIPLHHMVVCGLTQMSGKTTTLEALAWRASESNRVLAFSTKPHEGSFKGAATVRPFFREQCDWEYVQDLLEASLQERLKFERSWIIQACKGARSLGEVHSNVRAALGKARGISHSVYTNLDAYLEKVLPEIRRIKFADALELAASKVGVMQLAGMRTEVQSLVIRSVASEVWRRHRNTILIIPEAWKFLPQARGNPVKRAVERLVREGAAAGNFLWIDSQDITGCDKQILKSIEVWLLGRQRERNEIRRMLDQIPASTKPRPEDIAQLPIGQFIACFGHQVVRTYVRPDWMDPDMARAVATGTTSVHRAIAERKQSAAAEMEEEGEDMSRIADLERQLEDLTRENAQLQDQLRKASAAPAPTAPAYQPIVSTSGNQRPATSSAPSSNGDGLVDEVLRRLRTDPQLIGVIDRDPKIVIHHQPVEITIEGTTLRGRLARLLHEGFFDEAKNGNSAFNELKRRGASVAKPNVYRELDKLAEWGFVTKEPTGGYLAIAAAKRRLGFG